MCNPQNEISTYGFETPKKIACKHLWKCCVEHHAFFRLIRVSHEHPQAAGVTDFFSLGSRFRYRFVNSNISYINVQAISENSPHSASQQWPHRPRSIEGSVEHQTTPARFCAASIASSDATQQLSRAHHARRHVWQQELWDGKDEQQWWKVWNKINFRTSASIHVSIEFIVHNFFLFTGFKSSFEVFFLCFYWKHFSLVLNPLVSSTSRWNFSSDEKNLSWNFFLFYSIFSLCWAIFRREFAFFMFPRGWLAVMSRRIEVDVCSAVQWAQIQSQFCSFSLTLSANKQQQHYKKIDLLNIFFNSFIFVTHKTFAI